MEQAPTEPGHRTFIATVVFIDIVGYSERLVTQQVELKTRLNGLIAGVLEHVPPTDRMMLDTGDGAALCFLGDPEDALFAASNLRASTVAIGPELALRIGINLGPVRVVKDVNGQPNMLGDGINVSQRVMSFAEPNQILVSRSYYEIVSRLSQEYTRLFQYLGVHRDKHVREHEVYVMTAGGSGAAAPAADEAAAAAAGGPPGRVESSELVPVAGARFEPAVLARVEGALAECIGPLARLLVRKAAKTATDVPALCDALDATLPETERAGFRRRLGDIAGRRPAPAAAPGRSAAAPVPVPAARPTPVGRPLSPEVLAEAGDRLAVHIGPVAKLLVKRAAKQATGARDLYERLAAHIDDPQDRRRFAAATEELSEP
ncbi:MAG TPA: adenylate/guanylate cyclase domain-containing protein [Methylomirabilota bacterium]|nr:adenylate/guanylate cyclase domain-containing protein [Methylomirabilota bacterium]